MREIFAGQVGTIAKSSLTDYVPALVAKLTTLMSVVSRVAEPEYLGDEVRISFDVKTHRERLFGEGLDLFSLLANARTQDLRVGLGCGPASSNRGRGRDKRLVCSVVLPGDEVG